MGPCLADCNQYWCTSDQTKTKQLKKNKNDNINMNHLNEASHLDIQSCIERWHFSFLQIGWDAADQDRHGWKNVYWYPEKKVSKTNNNIFNITFQLSSFSGDSILLWLRFNNFKAGKTFCKRKSHALL